MKKFTVGRLPRAKKSLQEDIAEAMRIRGWDRNKMARYLGISVKYFDQLLYRRYIPFKPGPQLEIKLQLLTGRSLNELWPEQAPQRVLSETTRKNRKFRDLKPEMLAQSGILYIPPSPEEVVESRELKDGIRKALKILKERDAYVIEARFLENQTLEEVAADLNITRERVRQIEARALRRLKHPMNAKILEPFFAPRAKMKKLPFRK